MSAGDDLEAPAEFPVGMLGIHFPTDTPAMINEIGRALSVFAHGLNSLYLDRYWTWLLQYVAIDSTAWSWTGKGLDYYSFQGLNSVELSRYWTWLLVPKDSTAFIWTGKGRDYYSFHGLNSVELDRYWTWLLVPTDSTAWIWAGKGRDFYCPRTQQLVSGQVKNVTAVLTDTTITVWTGSSFLRSSLVRRKRAEKILLMLWRRV